MKTIRLNLFRFDELDAPAKGNAIEANSDVHVDHNWWNFLYEDAKQIGIKITGFDLDRANYCDAEFMQDAFYTATQVCANHGQQTGTFRVTQDFIKRFEVLGGNQKPDNRDDLDTAIAGLEEEYLKAICREYLRLLDEHYEYLTSEEAVSEYLINNEYWFTADGRIATRLEKLAETETIQN